MNLAAKSLPHLRYMAARGGRAGAAAQGPAAPSQAPGPRRDRPNPRGRGGRAGRAVRGDVGGGRKRLGGAGAELGRMAAAAAAAAAGLSAGGR